MPRINIYERDNTGSSATTDFAVVFVPGDIEVAEGVVEDNNGCIYIPPFADDISDYLTEPSPLYDGNSIMSTYHMVEFLVGLGYSIIYKYIAPMIPNMITVYNALTIEDEEAFTSAKTEYANNLYIEGDDGEYTLVGADDEYDSGATYAYSTEEEDGLRYPTAEDVETTYVAVTGVTEENFSSNHLYTKAEEGEEYVPAQGFVSGTKYYERADVAKTALDGMSWEFLNDKNAYDIKFITTGPFGTVPVTLGTVQGTEYFAFDFTNANALVQPAVERKDCAVLVDLMYYADDVKTTLGNNGDVLAQDYQTALEFTGTYGEDAIHPDTEVDGVSDIMSQFLFAKDGGTDVNGVIDASSREYTLLPNCTMGYSTPTGEAYVITVPSSIVYLYQNITMAGYTSQWLSVAGVNRGVVGDTFTPDLQISKYFVDTTIIKDGAGVSFNAIVDVRPYGYTIWGDRTLIEQDATRGVQATSYMSLRNLVSDVAKTAYHSAIRHTYETNNDITWMNFKASIVTLLDRMVTSGVLQAYKVGRGTTTERNKMVATITLYPYLPVENFDIYINLENAEMSTSEEQ